MNIWNIFTSDKCCIITKCTLTYSHSSKITDMDKFRVNMVVMVTKKSYDYWFGNIFILIQHTMGSATFKICHSTISIKHLLPQKLLNCTCFFFLIFSPIMNIRKTPFPWIEIKGQEKKSTLSSIRKTWAKFPDYSYSPIPLHIAQII